MSKRKTSARLVGGYTPYQRYQIESSGIKSYSLPTGERYYLMSSTDPNPFPVSPGNGWDFVHAPIGRGDWIDDTGQEWSLVPLYEAPPRPLGRRARPPEAPPKGRSRVRYSNRVLEGGVVERFPIIQVPVSKATIADVDTLPAKGARPPKGAIGRIRTDSGVQWVFPAGADLSAVSNLDLAYQDISTQRGSYDTRARGKVNGRPRKIEPLGEGRQGGRYASVVADIARALIRAQTGR